MQSNALAGKRVVVTRASHQAAELSTLLREYGAQPLEYPCIKITPPEDTPALDQALHDAAQGAFDWLVLTSVNTVYVLKQRLDALNIVPTALKGLQTAAIGPATASAAKQHLGLEVAIVPDEYVAEALAAALPSVQDTHILLPRAEIARTVLADRLTESGAHVTAVTAYHTVIGTGGVDLPELLVSGQVDALTMTSSSTARFFVQRVLAEGGSLQNMRNVCVACIGPITATTAREHDLNVDIVADTYTLEGLVKALLTYYSD